MIERINGRFQEFGYLLCSAKVTDSRGTAAAHESGFKWPITATTEAHRQGNKLMFVGNGGSSDEYGFVGISHLALCHAILDPVMGWRPRPWAGKLVHGGAR